MDSVAVSEAADSGSTPDARTSANKSGGLLHLAIDEGVIYPAEHDEGSDGPKGDSMEVALHELFVFAGFDS